MDTLSPDAAPAVLQNLIAAGLVSHEMIGDPARVASETACLQALCGLVAGPIYRLDAFHYAFRPAGADLGGALGSRPSEGWAAAIEAALRDTLGPEAAWVSSTDLLVEIAEDGPEGEPGDEPGEAVLAAPVLLLRAYGAAAGEFAAAEPGVQAVINARFAALTAELAATDLAAGGLAAGLAARFDRLEAAVEDSRVSALEGLSAALAGIAAAQEGLGLALAEALARIEARIVEAPEPAPGFAIGFGAGFDTGRDALPAREPA